MSGPMLFVLPGAIRQPARGGPSCPLCQPPSPHAGAAGPGRGRGGGTSQRRLQPLTGAVWDLNS